MAVILHDPATRSSIRNRVERFTAHTERRWGRMTHDQMLWHVNQSLAQAVGEVEFQPIKAPLPLPIMKFVALRLPWPKGVRTAPELEAGDSRYDLEAERARCLRLIDTFAAKSIDSRWPNSAIFGRMSGREVSRLQFRHLDHHLKQFGA